MKSKDSDGDGDGDGSTIELGCPATAERVPDNLKGSKVGLQ